MARLKALMGLIWLIPGAIFIAVALPLARGEIKPNALYGFRTVKTLSDPRIWYEVNRVHGHDLMIAGIAMIVGSLVVLVLRKWFSLIRVAIINLMIMLVALGLVLAHTFWVMAKF